MPRFVNIDSALTVPQCGFGAMGLSQSYGIADREESKAVLRRAVEIGCTFINTARIYTRPGEDQHNEKLIGEVLREGDTRSKVTLTTKWGLKMVNGELTTDGSPEYARQCIDDSIANLGSAPDIFLLHRIDKNTPVEESIKAMEEARQAGKCKYIGLSAMSAATLRRAAAVAKIDFVEVEFSPWERTIEANGVVAVCKELGVKIISYSPLGKGFLTGRFRKFEDLQQAGDARGSGAFPRFEKENFEKNFAVVEAFETLAEQKGCKPGQLALAWGQQVHGDLVIPIPGTKSIKYLEENFASTDVVLSEKELASIQETIDAIPIVGAQYNEKLAALLDE